MIRVKLIPLETFSGGIVASAAEKPLYASPTRVPEPAA